MSAVGTFNDWTPGAHKLVRRKNGTRSVTITVAKGQSLQFRYLGEGGVWFDDEDAQAITARGLARHGLGLDALWKASRARSAMKWRPPGRSTWPWR